MKNRISRIEAFPHLQRLITEQQYPEEDGTSGKQILEDLATLLEKNFGGLADKQLHVTNGEGVHDIPPEIEKLVQFYREGELLGMNLPQEYTGHDTPVQPNSLNGFLLTLVCREWPQAMPYIGLTMGAANTINSFGSEEQKKTYIADLCGAEGKGIGSMLITEPNCGTDPSIIKSNVEGREGNLYLNGSKTFVTNAGNTSVGIVLAKPKGTPDSIDSLQLYLLDFNDQQKGAVTIEQPLDKIGNGIQSTAIMSFDDAKVQPLGEGKGLSEMLYLFLEARSGVAAQGIGTAWKALRHAFDYMKDRKIGNTPQYELPKLRTKVAKAMTDLEAALSMQTYCYGLFDEYLHGPTTKKEDKIFVGMITNLIKLRGTDLGSSVSRLAMDIHGGNAYCKEYPVGPLHIDSLLYRIYEGHNDVQELFTARILGNRELQRRFNKEVKGMLKGAPWYLRSAVRRVKKELRNITWLKGAVALSKDREATAHIYSGEIAKSLYTALELGLQIKEATADIAKGDYRKAAMARAYASKPGIWSDHLLYHKHYDSITKSEPLSKEQL